MGEIEVKTNNMYKKMKIWATELKYKISFFSCKEYANSIIFVQEVTARYAVKLTI